MTRLNRKPRSESHCSPTIRGIAKRDGWKKWTTRSSGRQTSRPPECITTFRTVSSRWPTKYPTTSASRAPMSSTSAKSQTSAANAAPLSTSSAPTDCPTTAVFPFNSCNTYSTARVTSKSTTTIKVLASTTWFKSSPNHRHPKSRSSNTTRTRAEPLITTTTSRIVALCLATHRWTWRKSKRSATTKKTITFRSLIRCSTFFRRQTIDCRLITFKPNSSDTHLYYTSLKSISHSVFIYIRRYKIFSIEL